MRASRVAAAGVKQELCGSAAGPPLLSALLYSGLICSGLICSGCSDLLCSDLTAPTASTAPTATRPENVALKVKGLLVLENFITEEEERELLACVNAQPWVEGMRRRVQHYGFQFRCTFLLCSALLCSTRGKDDLGEISSFSTSHTRPLPRPRDRRHKRHRLLCADAYRGDAATHRARDAQARRERGVAADPRRPGGGSRV